jgi:hypothetical protein
MRQSGNGRELKRRKDYNNISVKKVSNEGPITCKNPEI